jgi:2',3'-cyclic-nucleotide 2'-phosphodiesterase (5'-nucleotidase family)
VGRIVRQPVTVEVFLILCRSLFRSLKVSLVALPLALVPTVYGAEPAVKEIAFIHVGDIHGHLIPRVHLRSDGNGAKQGGLARMYTVIEDIRARHKNSLLLNTGDTIQGSAEAPFTKGQAVVDVLNLFSIDFFAAGGWDYVYGPEQFIKLFAGEHPVAPWGALAANIYYDGEPYAHQTGQRVMEPYKIVTIDGVKICILGFSSERGPTVVGPDVANGFRYSRGEKEMEEFVPILRKQVDLLVVISELGLAGNAQLAEANPGIDVVLSRRHA